MTSAERILEYASLPPEAPLTSDRKLPPDWPQYGVISGERVTLRYSDKGPAVLKNLHFCFRAEEKVSGAVSKLPAATAAAALSFICYDT